MVAIRYPGFLAASSTVAAASTIRTALHWAITLCIFFVASPSIAEARCSCPSIKADGEGNSSCSANESGGRCTIDYNLFAEREIRAAELLSKELGINFTPRPRMNTALSLQTAERDNQLYEQVLLYLYVAAMDQLSRHPDTIDRRNLASIRKIADQAREVIVKAFSAETRDRHERSSYGMSDAFVDRNEMVVAAGCVEINTGEQWVMFKARWSPTAQAPRCRRSER